MLASRIQQYAETPPIQQHAPPYMDLPLRAQVQHVLLLSLFRSLSLSHTHTLSVWWADPNGAASKQSSIAAIRNTTWRLCSSECGWDSGENHLAQRRGDTLHVRRT